MKVAPHIHRFGDIRKMLVDSFQYVLLKKDDALKEAFLKASREKYGDPLVIDSQDEFHEFTDNFLYSYRFPDNLTVIDRFVSETPDLSEKEKAIVLRWKEPVVGLFQVKSTLADGFVAENLINEETKGSALTKDTLEKGIDNLPNKSRQRMAYSHR